MIRILSWNILHGGGKRAEAILDAIKKHKPDIVTLQEFRHSSNKMQLLTGLSEMGLKNQFVPDTQSARENSLIIAARYEFQAVVFPDASEISTHAIESVFPALGDLKMIAVHLPHKKKQLPYFHALLDLGASVTNGNGLLIGDFNCGIPFEDSETKSFYATHLFQQLLRNGWIDAWRSRNKNKREFTWISTKQHNGFRYDHALVTEGFNSKIIDIRYDHEVRLDKLSDHSLLLIDIDEN